MFRKTTVCHVFQTYYLWFKNPILAPSCIAVDQIPKVCRVNISFCKNRSRSPCNMIMSNKTFHRNGLFCYFCQWQHKIIFCYEDASTNRFLLLSKDTFQKRGYSSSSKYAHHTKKGKPGSGVNSELQLKENLLDSIIFQNGLFVALNKQYGLSVFGGSSSESSDKGGSSQNLIQALPDLSKKLECEDLTVGLSLKSFYSGVVLLCKHAEAKKRLERFLKQTAAQKLKYMSYLAITVGVPQCPHGENLESYIQRQFLHDREMSIVREKDVHSARKEGSMMSVSYNVKPLAVNTDLGVALVQVDINKDRWECVEVLMSHYMSPVLGDKVYSSRTSLVMDVPFPVSPHTAVPGKQRLPPAVEQTLIRNKHLLPRKALPLFLHRHQLTLVEFPQQVPCFITARPHKEFTTMLQCLGLYRDNLFL